MEINKNGKFLETENDELVVDAVNRAPPTQNAMTTTMAATTQRGKGNVGAKDNDDDEKADNTKGGEEG